MFSIKPRGFKTFVMNTISWKCSISLLLRDYQRILDSKLSSLNRKRLLEVAGITCAIQY